MEGRLRAEGKSMGLTRVIYLPTGQRLDRSNGLLSHYRVFTRDVRYGGGAWDWPSQAIVRDDGAVQIQWPSATGRPFTMSAVYRLTAPDTVDVETNVAASQAVALSGFESFLANYFAESFTNAAVRVQSPESSGAAAPGFVALTLDRGAWQMYPRAQADIPLMRDGRWKLEPNPVDWQIGPVLQHPLVYRRNGQGLTAALMAPASDCFAVAAPHQGEGHYSLYLSLFGRNLAAGESARARARLVIRPGLTEAGVLSLYESYVK